LLETAYSTKPFASNLLKAVINNVVKPLAQVNAGGIELDGMKADEPVFSAEPSTRFWGKAWCSVSSVAKSLAYAGY
jgi:hypothetical protein